MSNDTRKKDFNWKIATNPNGRTPSNDALLATVMDLRDELKKFNNLLHCSNFTSIPSILRQIRDASRKGARAAATCALEAAAAETKKHLTPHRRIK